MGRVTRRDPPKKIKDSVPGVFAGTIIAGGDSPGPTTVLTGDGNWTDITNLLTSLNMALRNEPVISLGDPEDPANPDFVWSENGDIITAGTPFN